MTIKAVTTAQLEQVRKMAKEKEVSRDQFQRGLDDGPIAAVLDSLKAEKTSGTSELVLSPGCRLHILRVPVLLDQPWQEAISEAGPNTPDNYNVRKVGDQYPPTGQGLREAELVLLNYSEGDGSFDKAVAWAKQNSLKPTPPRFVFAVGKNKPQLHRELGINPMYVVATEECAFEGRRHACSVWWHDARREACLPWFGPYGFSFDWFAFLRE